MSTVAGVFERGVGRTNSRRIPVSRRSAKGLTVLEIIVTLVLAVVIAGLGFKGYGHLAEEFRVRGAESVGWQVSRLMQASSAYLDEPVVPIVADVAPSASQTSLEDLPYSAEVPEDVTHIRVAPAGELMMRINGYTCVGLTFDTVKPGTPPTGALSCRASETLSDVSYLAAAAPTSPPPPEPTTEPTVTPTSEPTVTPTPEPTAEPTATPTSEPTTEPTVTPTPSASDPAGPAGPGVPGAFDRAVFTASDLSLTNSFVLTSTAGYQPVLYTKGRLECNTAASVEGYAHAASSMTLAGSCKVGGAWSRDTINVSTRTVRINGNATSSKSGMIISANPVTIQGDVTLAGTLKNSSGTPSISGTLRTRVPGLADPPSLPLPVLTYQPSQWAGWQIESWATFAQKNAADNGAPSSSYAGKTMCKVSSSRSSVNGALYSPPIPTVVDARSCSSLQMDGASGPVTLYLRSDLTIFASEFQSSGDFKVRSADGLKHTLRILIPWRFGSPSCSSSGAGAITFAAGGVDMSPLTPTLLYTASDMTLTNGLNMTGQIYACAMSLSNSVSIDYVPVGLP